MLNKPLPETGDLAGAPVSELSGVGPRLAARLETLGVRTIQDLLFLLPLRYQDRTRVVPIGTLRHGDEALVCGEVQLTQVKFGRRRSLVSLVADGSGAALLRFFHFSSSQQRGLARGVRVLCYGEARRGPQGIELVHPEYRVVPADDAVPVAESLTPVYPATEGLGQGTLRRLTGQALELLASGRGLRELLPVEVRERLELPPLEEAVRDLHRPPPELPLAAIAEGHHPSVRRLAFEELLAHHLSLRRLRLRLDEDRAPALAASGELRERFLEALPFELTGAQRRVAGEIAVDLARLHPMHRLAQGDVGCGKTVVAALAVLQAVESGYQVAIMAPTELLAEQHLSTFRDWMPALGVEMEWLAGKLTARSRSAALTRVASGEAMLVVGTHALFQGEVTFQRLGLVIIDEQHRFGVDQRMALRRKGERDGAYPHQLIMTATPIPRTLAMAAYADLDTSVIDEMPPGRTPVETAVVPDTRRGEVIVRVREACRRGEQAYWVCTLIDDSEALVAQAASETAAVLAEALPEVRVGLVHGRMKGPEKESVMTRFAAGKLDLLVATTVIEVGVDVPNASLMIIENAERLGLAQLHQLRGRVGRGTRRSVCVMLYQRPLGRAARARLDVLRESTDGFLIAQRDLELRGPGEVLGTRQAGMLQLRVADLARDRGLLGAVEGAASELLAAHPTAVDALIERWLGAAERYAEV